MTGKQERKKVRKVREFARLDASLPLCILTKLERTEGSVSLDRTLFCKSDGSDYESYYSSFAEKRKWRLTKG